MDDKKTDFIFGLHPILEAIDSKKQIDKLLIQRGLKGDTFSRLLPLLKKYDIPYQYVPPQKMNRICRKNHQGVIAYLSPVSFLTVSELIAQTKSKNETPFYYILDRISDVRNFGAILRTAECSGVHGVIIPSKGAAAINQDAVKTSTGAIYKIPISKTRNLNEAIETLQENGVQIVCCTEKTEEEYYEIDFKKPTAIVMGSEEDGISENILENADKKAKIPMFGTIGSLNVSVAAGVLMYEVVKQRQQS